VTIFVAKEPTKVAVPNVVGQDQASAASTLSAEGLTVITRTQEVTDQAQDGLVQSQDPAEGTRVAKGTRVTIFVGHFTTPTTPGPTPPGQ
jgi:beta-lactam-binding protein with PASTA domain